MISIRANFTKFEIPPITTTVKQVIGQSAIDSEHDRVSQAVNINDQSAKPLVARYAAEKKRSGRRPVRDLTLTGEMLRSRTIERIDGNSIVIAFADDRNTEKARKNDAIEVMTGLSPHDQERVASEFRKVYP